jgi:hypothetical protein
MDLSKFWLRVSQEEINQSTERDSHHCMIADAVKRTIPSATYISVDVQSIRFTEASTGLRYTFLTPAVAQRNLLKFDKGEKVKPFGFMLQNPLLRPAGYTGGERESPRPKAKRRRAPHKVVATKEREFGLRRLVEKE